MDELRTDTDESSRDGIETGENQPRAHGLRRWTLSLTLLPVVFCGLTYFAFIEYVLAGRTEVPGQILGTLRAGGLGVIALMLILAFACGQVLAERVTRPLRLLLRLAETGELPHGQAAFTHDPQWEVFELYRRVGALVHQNRSGAQAVEELERMRGALAELKHCLARPGLHGLYAELPTGADPTLIDVVHPLAANRSRLLQFFEELRERLRTSRDAIASLGADAGWDEEEAPVAPMPPQVAAAPVGRVGPNPDRLGSLARVRRVGTVMALESERLAGPNGHEIGNWFARFDAELDTAEQSIEELVATWRDAENGGPGVVPAPAPSAIEQRADFVSRWREVIEMLSMIERRLAEVEGR